MADYVTQVQNIVAAAGTARRVYFGPTNFESGTTWKVKNVSVYPNETSAANDSNYATLRGYKGDTAITSARTTASTALTQGTVDNQSVSGTGADLECTASAPFNFRVTHTGSGVAVEISVEVTFEVVRQ